MTGVVAVVITAADRARPTDFTRRLVTDRFAE